MKQQLTIGLVGFGCVGKGLYDILSKNNNPYIRIKKICVKDKLKKRTLPEHYFTFNYDDIVSDSEINTVVELIDDADQAFIMVQKALMNKKSVVTANKKMIAEHLEELLQLQKIHNTPFLYEASSCGGIPIIRTLEEYYNNEHLQSVSGIFNGSSNYILTHIFQYGKSYQDALNDAQRLGFAESNPSLDVDGFDAKFKLIILTLHAFGKILKPDDVFNIGISGLNPDDQHWITQSGLTVKLEARAEIVSKNQLRASVMPVLVPVDSLLGRVSYEFNTVLVKAAFSDQQQFIGKGAGGHPTGSAVLSDIAALHYNYKYEYHKLKSNIPNVEFSNTHPIRIVLSTSQPKIFNRVGKNNFEIVQQSWHRFVGIGTVTLDELLHHQSILLQTNSFVAQLHESSEQKIFENLHRRYAVQKLSSLVSAC